MRKEDRRLMTLDDARRAIYLDFEATATEPDRPALIGVLGPNRPFTQYVIDPDLRDAQRAHRDCQAADLGGLLAEIASSLETTDGIWCAWSTFDLSVIRRVSPSPSIRAVFDSRFRNGLDVVPAWAKTYGVSPEKADFKARNQLHMFFEAAGYRPDWRYTSASPAKWIRHVRTRMKAAGGRYRRVNASTHRDWHALLEYNRHDCVGLRHLVVRAAAESEKRAAYLNTTYSVRHGFREIRFRVGSRKPALDALVRRHGTTQWAHMTAWNPGLARFSAPENDARQRALTTLARNRGYECLPGAGQGPNQQWPAEQSVLVIGVHPGEARELARTFGQWAIVVGSVGARSRFEWCLDPGPDTNVVNQLHRVSSEVNCH